MDKIKENPDNIEASKLGALLKNLSKEEFKSFGKFLQSPWSGANESAIQLYELLSAKPHLSALKLSKKVLLQRCNTDGKSFNKTMNSLLSALEKFLVHQELAQDGLLHQQLLLRAARKHQANNLFKKTAAELLQTSADSAHGSTAVLHEHLLLEFQVLSELYFHSETDKFKPAVELLAQTTSALDCFQVASRLFFACEVFNRRQFVEESLELPELAQTIRFAQAHFAENHLIRLYLQVLELLRHDRNDALFDATSRSFFQGIKLIGKVERRAVLTYLVNYANRVVKRGHEVYLRKILWLYLNGLRHGLMHLDGEMPPSTFTNIANTASLCKKFRLAQSFIQCHQHELPKADRKSTVDIALAFMYFHKGNFGEAYTHAYRSDLSSVRYALIAKPLMLRTSYEEFVQVKKMKIITALNLNLDAFRKYLSRDKTLSPTAKQSYQHFVNILHSMAQAMANGSFSEESRNRLLKLLTRPNPPFAKAWLESKLLAIPVNGGKRPPKRRSSRSSQSTQPLMMSSVTTMSDVSP